MIFLKESGEARKMKGGRKREEGGREKRVVKRVLPNADLQDHGVFFFFKYLVIFIYLKAER